MESNELLAMFGTFLLLIVVCFVSAVVSAFIHEAGHLVCGLATGYKFHSFRIFKWTLMKTDDGYVWKQYNIPGTAGQCIMSYPGDVCNPNAPYFWYHSGGCLANLILGALLLVLGVSLDLGFEGRLLLITSAFISTAMAICNMFPFMSSVPNDGHNILALWHHPEYRKYCLSALNIVASDTQGKMPTQMPEEWFDSSDVRNYKEGFDICNRLNYACLQDAKGNERQAREILDKLMDHKNEIPKIYLYELECAYLLMELMNENRQDKVDELWTKQLQTYVKSCSKFMPSKLLLLYAYELHHNHDAETAALYRNALEDGADSFFSQGELAQSLETCRRIEEICR